MTETLAPILAYLNAAVAAYRVGMEAQGCRHLSGMVSALMEALQAEAFSVGPVAIAGLLAQILAAQERGDYLYVADLLACRLAPMLQSK